MAAGVRCCPVDGFNWGAPSGADAAQTLMDRGHRPVLLEEAIAALMAIGGWRIRGRHVWPGRAQHPNPRCPSPLGTLAAFDQDPEAPRSRNAWLIRIRAFGFRQPIFATWAITSHLPACRACCWILGVSSPQLDDPERGFSFQSRWASGYADES